MTKALKTQVKLQVNPGFGQTIVYDHNGKPVVIKTAAYPHSNNYLELMAVYHACQYAIQHNYDTIITTSEVVVTWLSNERCGLGTMERNNVMKAIKKIKELQRTYGITVICQPNSNKWVNKLMGHQRVRPQAQHAA